MAIDLPTITDRVRSELLDTNKKNPLMDQIEYHQAIANAYIELAARVPPPSLYTESAFTISAGSDTFTLPETVTDWTGNDGGAEYSGRIRIRLRSNALFLTKRTVEEIDAWRAGETTRSQARPHSFALWEDKNQAVQGRCYPQSKDAEVCDLFTALTVDDIRDYVGANLEFAEILFSRQGAMALVFYTAGMIIGKIDPDKAKAHGLDKSSAKTFIHRADVLLYQDEKRKHDLEAVGRVQRWVS